MPPSPHSTAFARLCLRIRRFANLKYLALAATDGILTRVTVVKGLLRHNAVDFCSRVSRCHICKVLLQSTCENVLKCKLDVTRI